MSTLIIPITSKNLGYKQVQLKSGVPFVIKNEKDFIPTSFDRLRPKFLVIQAGNIQVSWRDDGVAPTALQGMVMQPGDVLQYNGQYNELIFTSQSSGTLDFLFYA